MQAVTASEVQSISDQERLQYENNCLWYMKSPSPSVHGFAAGKLMRGWGHVGAGEEVNCHKYSLPVHVGEKIFI